MTGQKKQQNGLRATRDFRQDGGSGERNVLSLALSKPSCGYCEDTAWLQASKDFQGTRASNHGVPK